MFYVLLTHQVPLLDAGDIIIDGGNSEFIDTNRRCKELKAKGLHFIGCGVSGGEEGARHGPSMMPGGAPEAWYVLLHEIVFLMIERVKLSGGLFCIEFYDVEKPQHCSGIRGASELRG